MSIKKEKNKKSNINFDFKNQIVILTILSLLLGLVIGYILFDKSNSNILYLIFPILIIFSTWMLLSKEVKNLLVKKDTEKLRKTYLSFFENFYIFSSLNNSYESGFSTAVSNLESSELKNQLLDFLENDSNEQKLPFQKDILVRQDEIIEQCTRLYFSKEEFNKYDTEKLKSLLTQARKEKVFF